MPGIGNDVVALRAIDVDRTKKYRFYSKIIVDSEKLIYDEQLSSAISFEKFVWLAWSVKESAFKCLQRYRHDLVFSPSNTLISEVHLPEYAASTTTEGLGFDEARVYRTLLTYQGHQLYSRTMLSSDFIFTVVNDTNDFSNTWWKVKKIGSSDPEDQSLEVRHLLLHKLHELYPAAQFFIEKSLFGFPVLFRDGREADFPVSFSHHDHFVGCAFAC